MGGITMIWSHLRSTVWIAVIALLLLSCQAPSAPTDHLSGDEAAPIAEQSSDRSSNRQEATGNLDSTSSMDEEQADHGEPHHNNAPGSNMGSSAVHKEQSSEDQDGALSNESERDEIEQSDAAHDEKKAANDMESTPLAPSAEQNEAETAVYLTIRGEGEIGTILDRTALELDGEDTVLNVLKKVTRANKIQMEYRGGSGALAYVEGIHNIYEFDHGAESGWLYIVNGVQVNRSAGSEKVKPGDRIEWVYVMQKETGAEDKEDKEES